MRGLLANELGLRQTSDAVELATSDKIGLMAALKWKPFLSKPIHNENRAMQQQFNPTTEAVLRLQGPTSL